MVKTTIDFLQMASELGEYLCNMAFWHNEKCNWIGRTLQTKDENYYYQNIYQQDVLANSSLSPYVYDGTSGIALFLGYLYYCTKNIKFLKTAEGAIKCAISKINSKISNKGYNNLSFFAGNLGIAFVSAKLGIISNNEYYKEIALGLFKKILVDKNAQDESNQYHDMDIISGHAGAIPALLHMYDLFNKEFFLDNAISLGNELLSKSVKDIIGISWNSTINGISESKHNLLGFSHGVSGIGYSLLRLYEKTEQKRFLEVPRRLFFMKIIGLVIKKIIGQILEHLL